MENYSAAFWITILFLVAIIVIGVLILLPGDLSALAAPDLATYSTSKDWYGGLAIGFAVLAGIAVVFVNK